MAAVYYTQLQNKLLKLNTFEEKSKYLEEIIRSELIVDFYSLKNMLTDIEKNNLLYKKFNYNNTLCQINFKEIDFCFFKNYLISFKKNKEFNVFSLIPFYEHYFSIIIESELFNLAYSFNYDKKGGNIKSHKKSLNSLISLVENDIKLDPLFYFLFSDKEGNLRTKYSHFLFENKDEIIFYSSLLQIYTIFFFTDIGVSFFYEK